jgi:hypothetical protein
LRHACRLDGEQQHRELQKRIDDQRRLATGSGEPGSTTTATATSTNDKSPRLNFVEAVSIFFENLAQLIATYLPQAQSKFGPSSSILILRALQSEADVHATRLLDLFYEHYQVTRVSDEIRQVLNSKQWFSDTSSSALRDPKTITPLLDEISLMCQAAELFDRFLRQHASVGRAWENPPLAND